MQNDKEGDVSGVLEVCLINQLHELDTFLKYRELKRSEAENALSTKDKWEIEGNFKMELETCENTMRHQRKCTPSGWKVC